MYQYMSNQYKDFLPPIKASYCDFLLKDPRTKETGFVDKMIRQLKKPIHQLVFGSNQMPTSCPIKTVSIFNVIYEENS